MVDVVLACLLFVWPPSTVLLYFLWREVRGWVERRRQDQSEAEAIAAEGFPPPGPPTTDSLSDD